MYYFAYASTLNKKRMMEQVPSSKPVSSATLPNYKLVFTGWARQWRGGTATIKLSQGDKVRGAIYDVSEIGLQRLDGSEGYPGKYKRINVTVFDEDGTPFETVSHIWAGELEPTEPSEAYLSILRQGYQDWRLF